MTDLDTQSSFAVQPEIVLGQGKPVQSRIENFGVPMNGSDSTRIHHDEYPIAVTQIDSEVLRVCIGEPLLPSVAVLKRDEFGLHDSDLNQIEWSWLPDAHWQIAVHRHGQGIGTSRGLYADDEGQAHLYMKLPDAWHFFEHA